MIFISLGIILYFLLHMFCYRYKVLLVSLFVMSLVGCRKDSDSTTVYKVSPVFQSYLDSFIAEGKQRGVTLTLSNLIIEFGTATDEGNCGTCRQTVSDPTVQRIIVIDTTGVCWGDVTEDTREALVFHELGHCLLKRIAHKDATLPNGDLASLMNSQGDMALYAICSYDIGGTNGEECNKKYRRSYYIDELFNENAPAPDWGK